MSGLLLARNKTKREDLPQDRIDVLAILRIGGVPVTRLIVTRHYSRKYLYVEHGSRILSLVDVTDARHPALISDIDIPAAEAGSVLAAAGNAALITSDAGSPTPPSPRTVTIFDFADRAHAQAVRQFHNVTSIASDDGRGLVFLANDEGLCILRRNPADDPEVQERYAHDVIYNH